MKLTSRMALAAASLLALSGIHCTSTGSADIVELTPLAGTAVKGAPAADCLAAQEAALTFTRVNAHLEAGGDLYMYGNMENLTTTLGPWVQSTVEQLAERNFFEDDTAQFEMFASRARDFWPVLGYNAIEAFGMSSINLGDESDPFYSTRQFFFTGDTKPEGLMWDFSGNNIDLSNRGTVWPDNACMVGVVNPDFASAHTRLLTAFPELAELESRVMFDIPGILQSISGPAEFMMVDMGADGMQLMVQATDKGNMLYSLAAPMLSMMPGAEFTMDTLTVTVPELMQSKVPFKTLVLKKGTDSLTLMTMPDLDAKLAERVAAGQTLAKDADFQRLTGGLPQAGSMFLYYSKDGQNKATNWFNPGVDAPAPIFNQAMATMISFQGDGLATMTYSYVGMAEMQLRNAFGNLNDILDKADGSELLPGVDMEIEANLE